MNKKVIIAVVAIVVVVAVVFAVVFLMKDKKVELNLQELNTSISAMKPFDEMATADIDAETLETMYEISPDDYDEMIGKMPLMNIQASMYLVIKAKDGKVDDVKAKVESYAAKLEQIWESYLPEQYELVQKRKLNVVGNYVYLVVSESAEDIEKLINK